MTQSDHQVKLLEQIEYGSLSRANFQLIFAAPSSTTSTSQSSYIVAAQCYTEGKRKVLEAATTTEAVVKKRQASSLDLIKDSFMTARFVLEQPRFGSKASWAEIQLQFGYITLEI